MVENVLGYGEVEEKLKSQPVYLMLSCNSKVVQQTSLRFDDNITTNLDEGPVAITLITDLVFT